MLGTLPDLALASLHMSGLDFIRYNKTNILSRALDRVLSLVLGNPPPCWGHGKLQALVSWSESQVAWGLWNCGWCGKRGVVLVPFSCEVRADSRGSGSHCKDFP